MTIHTRRTGFAPVHLPLAGRRTVLLLFSLLSMVSVRVASAESRPNILWIFADDHTRQAIGAYGSRLAALNPTPRLDALARQGMLFERCYVGNSICAPSRATLLTGKHSHQHGKIDNRGEFNHNQQQFQKILQKHGYQTALIGKIHLAGKMQGFDYWEVLPGQGDYYQPTFITEQGTTKYVGYVGDLITDRALDWLEKGRDREKPFMLMVHHKATHRSWTCATRHVNLYEDITVPEPDSLFDDYAGRATAAHQQRMSIRDSMRPSSDLKLRTEEDTARRLALHAQPDPKLPRGEQGAYFRMNPEQGKVWDEAYKPRNRKFREAKLEPGSKAWIRWRYQRYIKDYLRTGKSIDDSVGRLLDYLKTSGLERDTVVMYASDQGFYLGEHGWFDKRFMYEESFSTPLIVRWPGVVKQGMRNSDLVQNIDWAPTFLDIAGAPVPRDMQGVSLVPLLQGRTPGDWRTSLYYHYYEYPGPHAVRRHEGVSTDRYKLIRFYGPNVPGGEEWEFYDLAKDPKEMKSEYGTAAYAPVVGEHKEELQRLRTFYDVPDAPGP